MKFAHVFHDGQKVDTWLILDSKMEVVKVEAESHELTMGELYDLPDLSFPAELVPTGWLSVKEVRHKLDVYLKKILGEKEKEG